jgi:hypothetical protein
LPTEHFVDHLKHASVHHLQLLNPLLQLVYYLNVEHQEQFQQLKWQAVFVNVFRALDLVLLLLQLCHPWGKIICLNLSLALSLRVLQYLHMLPEFEIVRAVFEALINREWLLLQATE